MMAQQGKKNKEIKKQGHKIERKLATRYKSIYTNKPSRRKKNHEKNVF